MSYYKPRALPHWNPDDAALFVTWRLQGSYPASKSGRQRLTAGQAFVVGDRELDQLSTGPHYLKIPAVAQAVKETLYYGANQLRLYELHAWVIMSNHVHILIDPLVPLPRITRSVKNFTAREATRILNRAGQPFWMAESYDRWVRSAKEFDDIAGCIEFNPVSAGLVSNPEDWKWSSASVGQEAYTTNANTTRTTTDPQTMKEFV